MTNPSELPDEADEPIRAERTAGLLRAGDPEGLQQLLRDYGGSIRSRLRRDFRRVLDDSEIDEAMAAMAVNVWHAARRYDPEKGSLRAWAAVIARNCALRLLELRRRRACQSEGDLDRYERPEPPVSFAAFDRQRLLLDLRECIDELPPLQRAVALADLEAGGTADAAPLAAQFATTPNSIYVSRQKARKSLRRLLQRRGHAVDAPDEQRGRSPLPPPIYEPRAEQG